MINILKKVWAIYALILLMVLIIISLPYYIFVFYVFPKKGIKGLIYYNHHILTNIYFRLILIRVKVYGKELLDRNQSYLIVSNHRTSLDFIINAFAFPGIYRYLAKKELSKIPILGYLIKHTCVLVDRTSAISKAKSIIKMKEFLKSGYSVFIYPEGTRNLTDQPLRQFHDGAFKIAAQLGIPIAVQTIVNIDNVSEKGKGIGLNPGTVQVFWEKPFETTGLKGEAISELKDKIFNSMKNRIDSAN